MMILVTKVEKSVKYASKVMLQSGQGLLMYAIIYN